MFGRESKIRKIASLAVSLALFLVIGGPWAVLQTVAWTKMIVDYSQGTTLGEAVAKTFDGNHPCKLCVKISKVKQGEEKSPLVTLQTKKEGPFLAVKTVQLSDPSAQELPSHFPVSLAYPDSPIRPPVPVPKA